MKPVDAGIRACLVFRAEGARVCLSTVGSHWPVLSRKRLTERNGKIEKGRQRKLREGLERFTVEINTSNYQTTQTNEPENNIFH